MENEKTLLEKIVEQKTKQITRAIEEAIDEGAEIVWTNSYVSVIECRFIDGLLLQKSNSDGSFSVVLKFHSEKIAKVFEQSKDDLEKQRDDLARQLAEVEQKIKNKKQ